jgi:homoserine dehydrogenase
VSSAYVRTVGGAASAADELRTVRLCLIGFGSVARAFCELLAQQEQVLAGAHGLRVLVTAVGTRSGSLLARDGLTPATVLEAVGDAPAPPQAARPASELLRASGADVLVELTVMEHDFAPVSTGHVLEAFDLGMDVLTANKGPIAWNWDRVAAAAKAGGRRIRFESTVMDGLPVFSLLELTLPDCRLLGFEAVLNATSNSIVDAMGQGETFADALAQMQAAGVAEADTANDIDGWDAAFKAAALANVAMGAGITPAAIARESLRDVAPERITQARAAGKRLRLVTSVSREADGAVHGSVRAAELDIDHPLAALGGDSLGALLHTDLMADVFVAERNGLVPQTAYGVYADLLRLCRES